MIWLWVALGVVLAVVVGCVTRGDTVRVADELPAGFPADGFDHSTFEALLERYVTSDGKVRYQQWHDDGTAELDRYVAALARYSPENAPERFPTEADRRTYWIQAYNALVIKGVLVHWPIESVQDVKAPVELKAGQGFFYNQRFVLGGREINLYKLENGIIRERFTDPRVHFVLNCASEGCPIIRPEVDDLDEATREFLQTNVVVDDAAKTVTINAIFDWYADDFLDDLARQGIPKSKRTIVTWLQRTAEGDLKARLEEAGDYEVRYADYDWGLNIATQ